MRALVVIDYQNDFVDGPLGSPDAAAIEDRVCSLVEEAIAAGDDVFVTMDTHGDDYLSTREGMTLPTPHCIRGTRGWELHGRLRDIVIANETGCRIRIIEKSTFGCADLMVALQHYDEIELCGVATDVCVLANAVIARTSAPGARVLVRADAVASYDRRKAEEALDVMGSLQIEVVR